MIALWLAVLGVVLIWPVPSLLARSVLALRHPVAALLLWQAVGLGTGLSAVGAGIAYWLSHRSGPSLAVGVAAVAVALYLLAVMITVTVRTLARRRRHRMVLDLVGTPLPALPGGRVLDSAMLVDSATAMAYCLPGLRPRVVVTSAVFRDLTPGALAAVVAHERAHLDQRHDLVVLPFVAWQAALPFLPGARTARAAVALLVEALADDTACDQVGPRPLGEALRAVALSGAPSDMDSGESRPSVEVRLARLGA